MLHNKYSKELQELLAKLAALNLYLSGSVVLFPGAFYATGLTYKPNDKGDMINTSWVIWSNFFGDYIPVKKDVICMS